MKIFKFNILFLSSGKLLRIVKNASIPGSFYLEGGFVVFLRCLSKKKFEDNRLNYTFVRDNKSG